MVGYLLQVLWDPTLPPASPLFVHQKARLLTELCNTVWVMSFLSSATTVRVQRRGLLGSTWVGNLLLSIQSFGDGFVTPSHKLPRGLLFPCTTRPGFPWNGVSLVFEGLARALSGHTAASRPCSSHPVKVLLSHQTCLLLVAAHGETFAERKKKNQGVSECPRLWHAA